MAVGERVLEPAENAGSVLVGMRARTMMVPVVVCVIVVVIMPVVVIVETVMVVGTLKVVFIVGVILMAAMMLVAITVVMRMIGVVLVLICPLRHVSPPGYRMYRSSAILSRSHSSSAVPFVAASRRHD